LAISHRFRYTAIYSLKLFIKNCGHIAANCYYLQPIESRQRPSALSDGTMADLLRVTIGIS